MTPRIGEAIQPRWDRTTALVLSRLQPALEWSLLASRTTAGIIAFALRPAALLALSLGVWRLGIDLGWTQDFFISTGFFSHWQVWFMLALSTYVTASFLSRIARPVDEER